MPFEDSPKPDDYSRDVTKRHRRDIPLLPLPDRAPCLSFYKAGLHAQTIISLVLKYSS